jgi:hypothetical protein
MTYVPRAPRRPPRSDEVALLRTIAAQPSSLADQGPVGRCVKRGWCEPVFETSDNQQLTRSELRTLSPAVRPKIIRTIGYALTEAKRRAAGLGGVTPSAPSPFMEGRPL